MTSEQIAEGQKRSREIMGTISEFSKQWKDPRLGGMTKLAQETNGDTDEIGVG